MISIEFAGTYIDLMAEIKEESVCKLVAHSIICYTRNLGTECSIEKRFDGNKIGYRLDFVEQPAEMLEFAKEWVVKNGIPYTGSEEIEDE